MVLGDGLPALFQCYYFEERDEQREQKKNNRQLESFFLRIRGPKLDSGPQSGREEEGERLGGMEGMRVEG